ncbi:hypothetical protein [Serinibacter salmoneus]|uniref:Uncharacterized protein n=1 Tax=Serinibacter salmoneus TaxID=556530 RepID=A0A2A9CZE4_9MICO|nr:hypothetical protein [Serinibacter salmoneus]PFG19807.1 hypothetical protein ATL40_1378 [Serinibacter salmoneus]
MTDLPRSVALALLWPRLVAGSRPALSLLTGDDEPHRLQDAPLPVALADLGVHEVWAVLPSAGDPQGLPPAASAAGIEAGEAVVARTASGTCVLVPEVTPFGSALEPGWIVTWQAFQGPPAPPAGVALSEVRRELLEAMHDVIEELTRLDVASEDPEVREALLDLRAEPDRATTQVLQSLEAPAAEVLLQALRLETVVALALAGEGAALSASEAAARSGALVRLRGAARAAVAVASRHGTCSSRR